MYFEVIFDLETKYWFNEEGITKLEELGVSIMCMYAREVDNEGNEIRGQMMSFWDNNFEDAWQYFRKADRIIGFNSIKFDVPVLMPFAPSDFEKLNHFDIYQEIKKSNDGFASSLNSIAKSTLGIGKVDSAENATVYWQKGDKESLFLLEKYCRVDVEITKEVYDFVFLNKNLKYIDRWNSPRIVELDFSYPKEPINNTQPSLF